MNKLVAFLQACGTDAGMAEGNGEALVAAARRAGLSENEVAAIVRLDREQIAGMLAARTFMTCCVFPAKDPEPDQGDGDKDDRPDEPSEPASKRLAA